MEKLRRDAIERLLRFSDAEYDGFGELRVENLTAEQLAALKSMWGLSASSGLLKDAARPDKDWWGTVDAAVAPAIAALQAQDPRGYAEYQRLKSDFAP